MLNKEEINTKILKAAQADALENPTMIDELSLGGPKRIQDMLELDILRALRGESGQALFPHVRGAVKDIISNTKGEMWAESGHMLLGQTTTTSTAPAREPSTWEVIGGLASSLINAGAGIYVAREQSQLAKDQLAATQLQTQALQQAKASAAAAAAAGSKPMQAGMGFDMSTVMIGVAVMGGMFLLSKFLDKPIGRERASAPRRRSSKRR
jgi:hypothetical protein